MMPTLLAPMAMLFFRDDCRFSVHAHVRIDGLVQDDSISFTNALGILQSCTKPSIYVHGVYRGSTYKASAPGTATLKPATRLLTFPVPVDMP